MSAESWAIVAASVGLAGLILNSNRTLATRLEARMDRFEARMDRLESEVVSLGQRMAHLAGLLEGLREAIAHNRAA